MDKFPSSTTLYLVRKAVAIVSATAPGWFIEYVGPFFWDKRKEIAAEDLGFFINRSWNEQYESWGFFGSALAAPWERTIKEALQHLHDNDRESLRTIPKSLVAMYARYLQLCQTETSA
jgi:hypothetical protein